MSLVNGFLDDDFFKDYLAYLRVEYERDIIETEREYKSRKRQAYRIRAYIQGRKVQARSGRKTWWLKPTIESMIEEKTGLTPCGKEEQAQGTIFASWQAVLNYIEDLPPEAKLYFCIRINPDGTFELIRWAD